MKVLGYILYAVLSLMISGLISGVLFKCLLPIPDSGYVDDVLFFASLVILWALILLAVARDVRNRNRKHKV